MVNVFTFTSIVMLGLLSCQSHVNGDCIDDRVQSCRNEHENPGKDCPYYDDVIACLRNINDPNAQPEIDLFEGRRTENLNYCPGAERGMCYFNYINNCKEDIPFTVLSGKGDKDGLCMNIEEKVRDTKKCYDELKEGICNADMGKNFINARVAEVEEVATECRRS